MSQIVAKTSALPQIVIGTHDYDRLLSLANGITEPMAEIAEHLLIELERTRIVPQSQVPLNAVCMGSTVSFTTSDGFNRTFKLVYPGEADISSGKVSVLTPVGAALIGLREGQTIPWTTRDGGCRTLTVLSVRHQEG